ncbi:MAG: dihydrodipicolinate synthase family protein [Gammaproteobacteria bacterium]|nr:dihydrodipicolinate synthase family protein [Gammaproteobacteria bacterium]
MPVQQGLMEVGDVTGAWAIMPTPSTDNASDWRVTNTVDLNESARVVDALIEGGVDGILSLGTLGEGATLSWEEKTAFMGAIIESARGRVPIFVGTTSLNTRETIRQTRIACDMGADGTMLGLPMWCAPSVDVAVQFYRDVAEACPDMALCIYANTEAFKFEFPRPFWAQVAGIRQVVTAKYIGIGPLLLDLALSQRQIKFLPLDMDYYGAARMDPEFCDAFWTSGAVCGPELAIALRDEVAKARQSHDWNEAGRLSGMLAGSLSTLFPNGSFQQFSMYNIGLEKARMDAAGWMKAGPVRPPYHLVPEPFLEGARQSGRAWAEICAGLKG